MTLKEIQGIIKDFESSNLTTLELETGDVKLRLSKLTQPVASANAPVITQATTPAAAAAIDQAVENRTCVAVKSPLVGTFYASATPSGEAFAKVGQIVKKGATLCIIEAMKIMNEIAAPVAGVIERIDVKNGQVVGYDQVLLTIHTGASDAQ
ncbi:MAG TPA: acetyl-CoA carboxylase biotin carboxyl carrier protein [Acholeplasmatales bacterium]|nr:MAG: acetyl-CoA carboxylase, biotin carboxyl carrier protein [Tenericutes bacterium GWF2_57_13]HAQ56202.1 acetyl-CoA carboxylase biotin carboxyl carrier protein [Acholeplasmatales bacterium]